MVWGNLGEDDEMNIAYKIKEECFPLFLKIVLL